MFIQFTWVHALLIRESGDIEINPGCRPNLFHRFSIRNWNLNILTEHDYLKVSPSRAHAAIEKFVVVWLPETYLDSSNQFDDDNFNLQSFSLVFGSILKILFI